jgi:ABC-type phosphate transport system auxiliary subunit
MAMEEILQFSKSIGGAVLVSSYHVLQDTHVFDLLEPKDQEVIVLEDSQGKTHLKGLSKVVHYSYCSALTKSASLKKNREQQIRLRIALSMPDTLVNNCFSTS